MIKAQAVIKKSKTNLLLAVLAGLSFGQTALAASTTINFDNLPNNTTLTNQYQSSGVQASGVTVFNYFVTNWLPHSASNIALSLDGLMQFDFDPAITGNIKTVSAYVSSYSDTGIYAYDANGVLVGQSIKAANAPDNTLLSVTSSGNPIVHVSVHDGGADFAIDDLTFVTGSLCTDGAEQIVGVINALPLSAFSKSAKAASQLAEMKADALMLQQLVTANLDKKKILIQLGIVSAKVILYLKPSAGQKTLLTMLYTLGLNVGQSKCN